MKKTVVDSSKLEYGMSTLHCRIRFFDFLLHFGYKKKAKNGSLGTRETKKSLQNVKPRFKKHLKISYN